ncbi:hypothetical protein Aci011_083 [Acinetobacter phage vB_AbaM_B09_Aci01-1]|uniref:Uncharacterized protein n=2 Tax=Saclayvirus TaxID=2733128 RepID=A0A386KKC3_9CAUD|nr:hypothetical protein HOU29_gp098 [Acinetobacter phage vB_AbaM_B09_Aci01-1]YP_009813306.1 hypothetical protein HOU30_gp106 [Acinetobacter phage vB_AbaM_B09_Aci02-2]AZF88483.1 hypothetical protein TAC_0095 [Acinetobacter phage TAC1]QMP19080.1 hypothetical protein FKOIJHOC_00132 [Acinetobacter phage Ab_121]AYD85638.1 hypothetical protein Aci011_083 [Acinetobacter phage vB_AbaM_B09_Aci01-1]AYD85800.1 hypothetical protein Aci022_084 [Acinetobacter phage vB_AbaM_B09_Aci02-2]
MGWLKAKKQMVITIGENIYKVIELRRDDGKLSKLRLNRVVNGEVVPYIHKYITLNDACSIYIDGVIRYKVQMEDGSIGFISAGAIQ